MKVMIDGTTMEFEGATNMTVNGLITKVKERISPAQRFIRSIVVDAEHLGPKNEKSLLHKKVKGTKVEISTDTPLQLADRTLFNAESYMADLKSSLENLLHSLDNGGEEEDYDRFMDGLKGWQTVMQLLGIVRELTKADFAALKTDGKSFDEINEATGKMLAEVKVALSNCDIVYFKDLIRYELIPCMDRMIKMIRMLETICHSKAQ